jgi:1,4-dihydroxy-2-naphthoate octaprenyltransferase
LEEKKPDQSIRKGVVFVTLFFLLSIAAFFIPYGGFDWWEAWLILGLTALSIANVHSYTQIQSRISRRKS